MTPGARRGNTLSSSLGLGERLFASSDERRCAAAIEDGLETVEAGAYVYLASSESSYTSGSVIAVTGGKAL